MANLRALVENRNGSVPVQISISRGEVRIGILAGKGEPGERRGLNFLRRLMRELDEDAVPYETYQRKMPNGKKVHDTIVIPVGVTAGVTAGCGE